MVKKSAVPSPKTLPKIHTTRMMAVEDLTPAPYNPRRITPDNFAGLKNSIEKFGLVQDPILNVRTGHIVGGHQRIAAIKELGLHKVRVLEVDLSEAEEMALNISLNNQNLQGEFTDDLQALLDQLHSATPDLVEPLNLNDLWNGSAYAQGEPSTEKEDEDVMIKCPKCKHRFKKV